MSRATCLLPSPSSPSPSLLLSIPCLSVIFFLSSSSFLNCSYHVSFLNSYFFTFLFFSSSPPSVSYSTSCFFSPSCQYLSLPIHIFSPPLSHLLHSGVCFSSLFNVVPPPLPPLSPFTLFSVLPLPTSSPSLPL